MNNGHLGGDSFIATNEDKDWSTQHAGSLDLIVSIVSFCDMPLQKYLMLQGVGGQLIQVGASEEGLPSFNAFAVIAKGT